MPRRALAGIRARLLIAHLIVIAVGSGTLLLAAGIAAPRFFEQQMAEMMRGRSGMMPGMGPGMMPGMGSGQGGPGPNPARIGEMDALLNEAYRNALIQSLLVAGLVATAAAVAASLVVSQSIATPISRFAAASRRIASGDYGERVPVAGTDEVQQLAESFNRMAASLEDAERRRLALIGDVAHEMRTPIATLEGYLEGLLDEVVEPSAATWAKLHTEAGRLRRLVEDLQELSRAEAGQLSIAPRATNPSAIVRAVADRLAGDATARGLELRVDLAPGLPRIWADPDRVVQVLTNLLSNAIRYTPDPGVVAVSARQTGTRVRFEVRDTGLGIAAEHLPHVFERFYRVDKSRARALGGAGVGLTIAKALVEAMGGEIRAESGGLGHGATFSFELPAASGPHA